jgi:hypothetical protein
MTGAEGGASALGSEACLDPHPPEARKRLPRRTAQEERIAISWSDHFPPYRHIQMRRGRKIRSYEIHVRLPNRPVILLRLQFQEIIFWAGLHLFYPSGGREN